MNLESLCFNGLNGATGEYLLPSLTPPDISAIARGEKLDPKHIQELKQWWQGVSQTHFAPTAFNLTGRHSFWLKDSNEPS